MKHEELLQLECSLLGAMEMHCNNFGLVLGLGFVRATTSVRIAIRVRIRVKVRVSNYG